MASFREGLPDTTLARSEYFKFPERREEYLVSQGVLRFLLSRYLGKDPVSVRIDRKDKGKPWCREDPSLCFNMSNSGGVCVLAFARDQEVGVDVEALRTLPDVDELIRTNFKPAEIRQINKDPREKQERFFRFWTFKESYLKAIGEGMRLPPENLEFRLEKGRVKLLSSADVFADDDWCFQEFSPEEGFTGTLTHRGKASHILEKRWDPRLLNRGY